MSRLALWMLTIITLAGSAAWAPAADIAGYEEEANRLIELSREHNGAWEKLTYLCDRIGPRLSGSDNLQKAIAWARETLEAEGLSDVRLQPVQVPHWVRGEEEARMLAPFEKPIELLALGRSIGTPDEGITAEVVVADSFEEFAELPREQVEGKIMVWNAVFTTYGETVRYRSRGMIEAAKKGAVASLVRSIGPQSLNTPHTGVMSNYDPNVPKIPAAAIPIEDAALFARLQDAGVGATVHLKMGAHTLPDATSHNVIAEIPGAVTPEEIVVFGGHIDSWDVGQGAHDDGGGVATTMEAARLIIEAGLQPARTLRLVLWTNEENGSRGAKAYRASLGDEYDNHVAAFESDVGVEELRGFGVTVRQKGSYANDPEGQESAQETLRQIAQLLQPLGSDEVFPTGGGVDISPLMALGIPGVSIHTVEEIYWNLHHTHADTVDKVDPEVVRNHAASIAIVLYIIADMPGRFGG